MKNLTILRPLWAFALVFALSAPVWADDREDVHAELRGQQPAALEETATASSTEHNQSSAGMLDKQTERVVTRCFPQELKGVLAEISQHFGKPVIVTSGYRPSGANRRAGGARHSYHTHCQAADIQIAGVSPSAIAQFARSLPAVGGVGRYGHTRSVHVDVGGRHYTWYGRQGRSRRLG